MPATNCDNFNSLRAGGPFGAGKMASAVGGVLTLGVFGTLGIGVYQLGREARSRTVQLLGVAVLFLLLCAVAGSL